MTKKNEVEKHYELTIKSMKDITELVKVFQRHYENLLNAETDEDRTKGNSIGLVVGIYNLENQISAITGYKTVCRGLIADLTSESHQEEPLSSELLRAMLGGFHDHK